jgi:tetratricopeptide (TPR) repeat protein
LEIAYEDFGVFKKEIAQQEAAIFGNISFCYSKDQHDRMQIEFCTKVIDRSPYIEDINVLIKAYLRRGLALESIEKYKKAVNDLVRVRELQPMNKQASQGIVRC